MTIRLEGSTIFINGETNFSLRKVANTLGEIFAKDYGQAKLAICEFYQNKRIVFENCKFAEFSTNEFSGYTLAFISLEFINCKIEKLNFFNTKIYEYVKFNSKTKIDYYLMYPFDVPNLEINETNIKCLTLTANSSLAIIDINNNSEIGEDTGLELTKINNSSPITFVAKNVKFLTAPEITGQLTPQSNFIDCKFNDLSFDSIQKYRQLKAIFRGHNDDKLSDEFERLELIATHQNDNKSDWVNKFTHKFYRSYNDYGRNFIHPLGWMGLIFLVSLLLFWCFGAVDYNENSENTHLWAKDIFSQINTSFSAKYKAAFTQSLINSLGYIGLFADNTGLQYTNAFWVVYGFIQKTIFTIMWFLFIMQVRRRFKLS